MGDSDDKGVTVDSALLDSKGRLRNLQCPRPGCGRLYSSESALRNHIRLKHPFQGLKPKRTATEGGRRGSTGSVGMPDSWRYTATRWPVQLPAQQPKQGQKSIVSQPPLLAPRRASGPETAKMVQYATAGHSEGEGWEGAPYHPDKVHCDLHSTARQESTASSQWSGWDDQQYPPQQQQAPPSQYVQMVLPPPQPYPDHHYHSQPPPHQHQGPPPGEWAHDHPQHPQHQHGYAPQLPQPEPQQRPAYTPFHPWEDRPRPATPPAVAYAPAYPQQLAVQFGAPGHHEGCVCAYCQPAPPQHVHQPPPGYNGHHPQCPCSSCSARAVQQQWGQQHQQGPAQHEAYGYAWQDRQQWAHRPEPVPVSGQ